MNDALRGHFVYERNRITHRRPSVVGVALVDRSPQRLQRTPQVGPHSPVPLSADDVLPVPLYRVFVIRQIVLSPFLRPDRACSIKSIAPEFNMS